MTGSTVVPLRGQKDERPLPAALEAEQAVLGAVMLFPSFFARINGVLREEHFSEEIHRRIFSVAATLAAAGTAITPVTMMPFLGDHEIAPGLRTRPYLAQLASDTVPAEVAATFATFVRDMALRRGVVELGRRIADEGCEMVPGSSGTALASGALDSLYTLTRSEDFGSTRREAGAAAAVLIERAKQIRAGTLKDDGISTGLRDLDRMTGGYRPGSLWIDAARPGMGKTVLAASSANKVSQRGIGVLEFSLEVAEDQIIARHLADLAYNPRHPITFAEIMTGKLDDEQVWLVEDTQRRLERAPLVIDVASRLTVAEIRSRVHLERERMEKRGTRLGVVFIDYLKMIQASGRYGGQRVYEVGEISAGLKQIAKDEKVCVVLLAQLNRALENREDKRPTLADLRESGDLEADADVVAFLHREAYHIEKSPAYRAHDPETVNRHIEVKNKAELILGKNRAGPTQTVNLWCSVAHSTVRNEELPL